jgi:DNA polymerase I-like protein with 3'-5' exonuclease and polymerase domains
MDGRIRTNFNTTSTSSGRLSSSGKFNAQQLPRDNPVVKGSIKAPPGYKIVSQDLVTAEMYVAAVLSGDTNLQDVFIKGKDFHSSIAQKVFKLDCLVEDLKKLFKIERQAAKAISFGILYGSGPDKVASTVNKEGGNFTVEEAVETIDDYFKAFPKLRKWLNSCQSYIKEHGYIYSALGRKRRLKNVFSPDKGIAGHEVRSGINFLVQSVASDINLLAAIDMNRELKKSLLDAKIIMLVHDSIVAVVKEEHVEKFCELLKKCTQKDRGVSIRNCPIGVDQEIGDDYSFGKWEEKHAENFKQYQISRLSDTNGGGDSSGRVSSSLPNEVGAFVYN